MVPCGEKSPKPFSSGAGTARHCHVSTGTGRARRDGRGRAGHSRSHLPDPGDKPRFFLLNPAEVLAAPRALRAGVLTINCD